MGTVFELNSSFFNSSDFLCILFSDIQRCEKSNSINPPTKGTNNVIPQVVLISISDLLLKISAVIDANRLNMYIEPNVISPINVLYENAYTIPVIESANNTKIVNIPINVLYIFITIKKWRSRWDSNPRTLARLPP